MLVLSRGIGQTLKIGKDVTIHIVAINVGKVRIGVEAPDKVVILRGEVDDDGRRDTKVK